MVIFGLWLSFLSFMYAMGCIAGIIADSIQQKQIRYEWLVVSLCGMIMGLLIASNMK